MDNYLNFFNTYGASGEPHFAVVSKDLHGSQSQAKMKQLLREAHNVSSSMILREGPIQQSRVEKRGIAPPMHCGFPASYPPFAPIPQILSVEGVAAVEPGFIQERGIIANLNGVPTYYFQNPASHVHCAPIPHIPQFSSAKNNKAAERAARRRSQELRFAMRKMEDAVLLEILRGAESSFRRGDVGGSRVRDIKGDSGRNMGRDHPAVRKHIFLGSLLRERGLLIQGTFQRDSAAWNALRSEVRRTTKAPSKGKQKKSLRTATTSSPSLKDIRSSHDVAPPPPPSSTQAAVTVDRVRKVRAKNILTLRTKSSPKPNGTSFIHSQSIELLGWLGAYKQNAATPILIDSGSDITLISEELWKTLAPLPTLHEGEDVNLVEVIPKIEGSDNGLKGYFVELPLFFDTNKGPVEMDVEAYIVKGMTTPFILGNDFAEQYRLSIVRSHRGPTYIKFGETGRRAVVARKPCLVN